MPGSPAPLQSPVDGAGDRDPAVCAAESIWDGTRWCPDPRPLEKKPGTRRQTAARIVLGPSKSLRTSGRSSSRKQLQETACIKKLVA